MNTSLLIEYSTIAFLGAMSPGPNFVVVASASMRGRKYGIQTAIGISAGVLIWLILCAFGFGIIIESVPYVKKMFYIFGSIFILYYGLALTFQKQVTNNDVKFKSENYFKNGLMCAIFNISIGIFYSVIFARIIDEGSFSVQNLLIYISAFELLEILWFLFVALFVSFARRFLSYYANIINTSFGIGMIYIAFGIICKL